MPEDVGGTPFPDGWEPDDDHDRGATDEEFASVVFDESFVRAAVVHEPTAVERLLAAAQARAEAQEAEARRAHTRGALGDDDHYDDYEDGYGRGTGHGPDFDDLDDSGLLGGRYGVRGRLYGKHARWHRPVAWMLALVMGVGMVALAFAAVYRGSSSPDRRDQVPPPASTGLEQGRGTGADADAGTSAELSPPAVSAVPPAP
ncbi:MULTISPECIES: hypothetical protein [unclassified Streptomyces]|uniref:SCO2584 family spore wall biosynthesis protein n=1 Tax=unclassified Streptomyces TaxID=2593676 RepID=UPI0004C026A2|nr:MULTISPECIES: hypothetical protein [unclassified Streptomyces]